MIRLLKLLHVLDFQRAVEIAEIVQQMQGALPLRTDAL
jgi:hypothetical protein